MPIRHLVRTIVGHSDWVRRVVPSDDGRLLASCSSDHVSIFIHLNLQHDSPLVVDRQDMGRPSWGVENGAERA